MTEQADETQPKPAAALCGQGAAALFLLSEVAARGEKLIAGPGFIFICDECVALCDAIIAGTWDPSMVDASKFKIGGIASETLLARLKPIEQTLQGMGNQLQTVVEELRGREVSWARIGEALGISRQSAWERFS